MFVCHPCNALLSTLSLIEQSQETQEYKPLVHQIRVFKVWLLGKQTSHTHHKIQDIRRA